MEFIAGFFGSLWDLDSFVLVMLVFFILGLVFKAGLGTSAKSAVMIGAGVLGITTVSAMMVKYLTPLAENLVNNTGIQNDIIDVSIAPVFGACISLPFFVLLFPIGLAVNYLLIKVKWTRTLNVDFLDLFAILVPIVPFYILTGNVILTLVFAILNYTFTLKVSDFTAKYYQKHYDLDGISISHPHDALTELFSLGVNWVFDHIPGLNKIDITISDIHEKLGVFGDPTFLSFMIGLVLGLVAGCSIGPSLAIGVAMAATCLLFPKAVGIIMEGIRPISTKMRDAVKSKLGDEEIFIGMDSAILTGYPEAVSIGALMIPLMLLVYFLVPTVKIIPSGESLATLAQTAGLVLPLMGSKEKKGNAFRTVVVILLYETLVLSIATWITPIVTDFCMTADFGFPADAKLTSVILGHPLSGLVAYLTKLFVH